MNILVVSHYGLYDDVKSSFIHDQACAYQMLGHRVRVIIPIAIGKSGGGKKQVSPMLSYSCVDGVELYYVHFLSLSRFGTRWFNRKSAVTTVGKLLPHILRGFAPDVIHAHTLGFDSSLGAWLKDRLCCPLVATTHGSDTSIPAEQGKYAELKEYCDACDCVVAVSSAIAARLRHCGTSTPISVILNGFSIQNLAPEAEGKRPCSVIQVGTFTPQKKFDITIRAFAALRAHHPTSTLTVIGWGREQESLKNLCISLGVSDSVRFIERIPNAEVLAEMAKTQFFCMTSVREGFGIVYLEAMASGCITIGTQGEGIADFIENGTNGFLVPPDDPEAIVKVMEWCLAHPQEAATIAARGEAAARELTWEANAKKYLALFASLCRCVDRGC